MSGPLLRHRFLPVRMSDLDAARGALLAVPLFQEDRPPQRLTGLVDWRMDGLISRIRAVTLRPQTDNPHYQGLALGPFGAELGEKLLFTSGGRLGFQMVLVLGLGSRSLFDGQRFKTVVTTLLHTVASMKLPDLALQLPGWAAAGIPARRACGLFVADLLDLARKKITVPLDLTFIEELEHQAEMEERIEELLTGR